MAQAKGTARSSRSKAAASRSPIKAAEIREMDIAGLKPAPYNPRRISDEAMAGLTKSLERFGYVEPVVWNKRSGYVVGGHQRLEVLKKNKVKRAHVVVVDLSPTDEKALNITLNNPNVAGEFTDQLSSILEEIQAQSSRLFTDLRLDTLLAAAPMQHLGTDADDPVDTPPLPKNPVTEMGDVWELGHHRLICGDSSDASTLARLLESEKIDLVVTSPPYASQRKYDESTKFKPIPPASYVSWFEPFAQLIRDNLAPGGSFFLNLKENAVDGELVTYVMELVLDLKKRLGFRYVDQFVWTHGGTPKAVQQRFKNGFEPIFQFTIGRPHKFRPDFVRHETNDVPDWGGAHPSQNDGTAMQKQSRRNGQKIDHGTVSDRQRARGAQTHDEADYPLAYPSNVLALGKNREALGHGAAFPISLPEFFINAYTDAGDIVYDPFGGSGTVLIASELRGRSARIVEISPAYCDVIVERWRNRTGGKPIRHKHGS